MSAPAVQHAQASGAALPQAAPPTPGKNRSTLYHLDVRQQPRQARMAGSGEKADRRPIDPPPIIRLRTRKAHARKKPEHLLTDNDLVTPTLTHTLFMFASLVPENSEEELFEAHGSKNALVAGSVVSSLFHLKDSSCFVFPDMSIRVEGRWRFKMSLYEVHEDGVEFCAAILTDVFQVYSSKRFPGMGKSTELSKSFAQQGLKLRIRRPGQKNEDEDDSETVQPAQTKPTPRRPPPASLEMSHSRSQGPHDSHNPRTGTSPRLALGPAARRSSPPSATSALVGAAASPRMQAAESSLRSTDSPSSASGLSASAAEDASSSGVAQGRGRDVEMHSATESSPPTPAEGGLPISAGGSRASLSMLLGEGCSSAKEVDGGDDGFMFM
ncbi:hypothetical protein Rhopal_000567-T1 [Rhodotorula paludigena]|uniref:Velvet domain-containing protein n=1 Tax=Rhodotorula paludigena TaxID=86838 RepID=A0AAV5GE50_9BASI|nr:hypothetical protein Rhopal_000567-T1 [Rhodotorula paludigena]